MQFWNNQKTNQKRVFNKAVQYKMVMYGMMSELKIIPVFILHHLNF